jgi:type IV secretion system protein VirD4
MAQAAFKGKPNLVADNSDVQIFFGVNTYPTADLVSKTLGTWTLAIETASVSASGSRSYDGFNTPTTHSSSWSDSRNWSEMSRPLLFPSEVMQLSGEYLIALVKGVRPILARRIKWYADPLFARGSLRKTPLAWWLLLAAMIALLVWSLLSP